MYAYDLFGCIETCTIVMNIYYDNIYLCIYILYVLIALAIYLTNYLRIYKVPTSVYARSSCTP